MKKKRVKILRLALCLGLLPAFLLNGCSRNGNNSVQEEPETEEQDLDSLEISVVTSLKPIDMESWLYNSEDNVYYQIGLSYCETPADSSYETLAIFVPDAYMSGIRNEDGETHTCVFDPAGEINGYTVETAPIVMPVETPGYSAQAPLTAYTSLTDYMNAGFIYVHAGCRGRDHGAPAGVTDLKAAIKYLRYADTCDTMPGNINQIFTFGMSGGGAQSALVGATGDSDLYTPYLESIGAVQGVSDAVLGSMCWCPITNLDSADEAYEWMMGVTRADLSNEEQAISNSLAAAFVNYINTHNIRDTNGNRLTLEESEDGIYQAGSYYDYIKSEIENSLNNFLSDTTFPYDASSASNHGGMGGMGFGGGRIPQDDVNINADDEIVTTEDNPGRIEFNIGSSSSMLLPDASNSSDGGSYEERDNISRNEASGSVSLSGTYETIQDYIDALNAETMWVTYDPETNTAQITSIADFVKAFKVVSKNLGAFDQLDGGQGENTLFGYGDGAGAHFDSVLSEILNALNSEYAAAYAQDMSRTDQLGSSPKQRLNMYTPLYYLLEGEDGYQTSSPAAFWRIRSGIAQSDTALTTEVNLALALENDVRIRDVDFAAVWGQKHVKAERTGDSTANFISWVQKCSHAS